MSDKHPAPPPDSKLVSEVLILPDGRVFVQNLTKPMAALLLQLNPEEPAIRARVQAATARKP